MNRYLFAILSLVASISVAFAEGKRSEPVAKWQLTITSSSNGQMAIVAAQKFADQSKPINQPGINIAVETQDAQVTWLRGERRLHSTKAEVPFGNRYGVATEEGDVTVLRVEGPAKAREGDIIEVEFLGVKRRFDIPVSEAYPASQRPKLSFRLSGGQEAQTTEKVGPYAKDELIKTGVNSNRLTVVMMGDGYTSAEIESGKYESDAKNAMSAFANKEPWNELLKVSNFYLVKVRSAESGADDLCAPDAESPCTRITVNSYFDASFGRGGQDRFLVLSNTGTKRALAAADKYIGAGAWDAIIVFVNSTKYGGTGGIVATTSVHSNAPEIAVHELGHTIGKLADEYENEYPGYPEKITECNVDSNGTNPKWTKWLTPGIPLPTPPEDAYNGLVGAFEGGRYKYKGVYRPMRDCMMRSIGQPFCPVCQEGLLTKALQLMNLYNRISPSGPGPFGLSSRSRTFKFTRLPLTEGEFRSTWKVCGRVAGNDVDSITVTKEALQARSSCSVSLKIEYDSPRLKSYHLSQTVTWPVTK